MSLEAEKLSPEEIKKQEEGIRREGAEVIDFRKPVEEVDTEDSPQVKMIKAEKLFDDAEQAYERIMDAGDALNEAKTEKTKNAAREELRDAKKAMPAINRELFSMLSSKFQEEIGDEYGGSEQKRILKMMIEKAIEESVKKIEQEKAETVKLFEKGKQIYERIMDAGQALEEAKTDQTREFAIDELALAQEEMPVLSGSMFSFLESKLKKDLGDDFKGSKEREVLYKMAEISVEPEKNLGEIEAGKPELKVPEPAEVAEVEIELCKHGKEVEYCAECKAIKDALRSAGVEPFKG